MIREKVPRAEAAIPRVSCMSFDAARRRQHTVFAMRVALETIASRCPAIRSTCLLLCGVCFATAAHGAGDAAGSLRQALTEACGASSSSLAEMAAGIPGSTGVDEQPLEARGTVVGWQRRFELPDGAEIRIERLAPGGQLRRLAAEYWTADPDGGTRPRLAAITDGDCTIHAGRRMLYEPGLPQAIALEYLDPELEATGEREPLNPPVPQGENPGGVPVALVDAGVNYLLPEIRRRLARDEKGGILGYDYWDLDRRPFDANPARSPFFPQRHGTRTATLLLREAPVARLVPYRYPRPDMSRMSELIRDAAKAGIVVVNMSMGSNNPEDWQAFASAAREHPHMLFVLSAGNNGRDIDAQPVYPAALLLDNAITVTSSDDDGRLAPGSNWGSRSVDLLVPAERLAVTDFDGSRTAASGSSYAAVRISALAARFLAEHPHWRAEQLKEAIFSRVLPSYSGEHGDVARGFLPRPDKAEQLPSLVGGGQPVEIANHVFGADELYTGGRSGQSGGHLFEPTFAYFDDTGWELADLRRHARQAAAILAHCGIYMPKIDVRILDGPDAYRYFHNTIATELTQRLPLPTPTVYFVRDTLQVDAYDAVAIGKSNSASLPSLRYTVWFTEATRDPGIALAHELAHILMDSGRHVETPGNLMRAETAPGNTDLTPEQCRTMVTSGEENGLITAVFE